MGLTLKQMKMTHGIGVIDVISRKKLQMGNPEGGNWNMNTHRIHGRVIIEYSKQR